MANIRFENITFHYGNKCILHNYSLEVGESQIVGIVGPSGCGKTTLMRCLCGFIKPETGSIYVGDTCVYSAEKHINISPERRGIGVVFQDYAVWPHLTVWENVAYPLRKRRMHKDEIKSRVERVLAQVRMTGYEKHLPSQLSGGQQQRVAIARALVTSGDVIVLDEPITNLDSKLREEMIVEIQMLQKQLGTTILYITHDQEAALQLCDRIAIMETDGSIVQFGTDEQIIQQPASRFVFEFIGVSNFLPVREEAGSLWFDVGEPIRYSDGLPQGYPAGQENDMGIRPMNVLFDQESPIQGTITREVFLGNQYNYFVRLGQSEIRVQHNTLDVLESRAYKEGETVGLRFINPVFYERKKVAQA